MPDSDGFRQPWCTQNLEMGDFLCEPLPRQCEPEVPRMIGSKLRNSSLTPLMRAPNCALELGLRLRLVIGNGTRKMRPRSKNAPAEPPSRLTATGSSGHPPRVKRRGPAAEPSPLG